VTRVAAVDLGTNSTRLLVADVEDGRIEEIVRRLRITRLGEGVDSRRRLLPAPVARVRNVLADYRREADSLGAERTLAVATSAVRDAENGEAFLGEVEWSYGFATRLLSGEEEALLTFRGVTAGKEVEPETLVFDVGGGSTELVLGGPGGVERHDSLAIGCVRLTERLGEDIAACVELTKNLLPDLRPQAAVGAAGTVTTLAALDLGLAEYHPDAVHGHRLSRETVHALRDGLAATPLDERKQLPGLDPDRAPVIVAGAAIVSAILDRYGLDAVQASEHDILHGAALAAAELPAGEEGAAPPGAYTCC
jgi:exopolyphosphatase/guanosine-5'-triphosphate,3'-diphosphate pyrophosphatase